MTLLSRSLLVWVFLSLSSSLSFADWTDLSPSDFHIPPPPAMGSRQQRADIQEILALQNTRDEKDCALERTQTIPTLINLFAQGPVPVSDLRTVFPLINRALRASETVSSAFKHQYDRPRPYMTDSRIHPCVSKPEGDKSYPSSHATMASVGACLLKEIFPAKATELKEYGDYLGRLRVIVGVHHPTDVVAGQELGADICSHLLKDPSFRKLLPPAR